MPFSETKLSNVTMRTGVSPAALIVGLGACLLLIGLGSGCFAFDLETSPQHPLIHPIAPEDGAEAVTNPPPMVFWYDSKAKTYAVQLAQDEGFSAPITVEGLELPMYNHSAVLSLGTWFWRYRTTREDGAVSSWSPPRRFTITAKSIPFPVPTLDAVMAELPAHPRVYVTPAGLEAFRERRVGAAKGAFFDLERTVTVYLGRPPETPKTGDASPPQPKRRGRAFWLTLDGPRHTPKVTPGTLEHASVATQKLAMHYLITGAVGSAESAKQRLLWQANFRVDVHQKERAHHDTVHCYEYGLKRMAVCYDYLYPVLSADERARVLEAIAFHGDAAYRKLRYVVRIHLKYQTSHAQQDMHELLTTALAVAGDLPQARTWLGYLIPQYVNRLAWGKDDGGYSEGHYYNYKWHGMVQCAPALRTATRIDLLRKPRFSNAGRFWLYCMNMDYWWDHFGDNFALHTPMAGNSNDRDGANFLASFYGDRYVKWWANRIDGGLKQPLWYLSDEMLAEKPPVDIPQAAVFRDVGWAALYDRFWDDTSPRLFFKSSPWGSHSHCHEDQNSFVIHAFGEILAIDKGYYGYYGDAYHKEICRTSRSHNTILVNGKGQTRGIQYQGRIERFANTHGFSYLVGEAGAAYGDRLDRFTRRILFIRPQVFIVLDQLRAPEPSTYSWQLNAFQQMALDPEKQQVEIRERDVVLRATHLLPGNLSYRQNNERPHPLKSRYTEAFPEMWTCWCETTDPAKTLTFLTVMEPFRAAQGASVRDLVLTRRTEDKVELQFSFEGKQYDVSFTTGDASEGGGECICLVRDKGGAPPRQAFFVGARDLRVGGTQLVRSDAPRTGEFVADPVVPVEGLAPVEFVIQDSTGRASISLERTSNSVGEVFDFGRVSPREPGVYRFTAVPDADVILTRDPWDPEVSSHGPTYVLRKGSRLIVRSRGDRPVRELRAELVESHRGRIINLVQNGDFEVGSPGFQPRGWWVRHFGNTDLSFPHRSNEDAASGKHCLKIFRENSRMRLYSRRIELDEAGRYVLRFKAKATGAGAAVNAWDSAGGFSVSIKPSKEWLEYRHEVDLKPGLVRLHCMFEKAEAANQTVWIDDLEFGPVAE